LRPAAEATSGRRTRRGLRLRGQQLSAGQRRLATLTGILLITSGDDDVLWLHVSAHIAFFVALASHVGLVLSRRLLPRMLPG
jgi:cytochrome b561